MRRLSLAAVAALAFAASACTGCKKEEPAPPPPAPAEKPAEPAPTPTPDKPAEPAAGGKPGSITGEALFSGKAPERSKLARSSDPFCNAAKGTELDESVLVEGGKLANVLVRITQNAPKSKGSGEVTVHQEGCAYRPRVQGAQVGQTVIVHNGDKTMHNVHSYKGTATMFNRAQPPSAPPLSEALNDKDLGVIKFKCDVHPWMAGYLVVSDHPFFATTDAKGAFTIKDVPPGKYTVEAWHEKLGTQTTEVTVMDGMPASATFTFGG